MEPTLVKEEPILIGEAIPEIIEGIQIISASNPFIEANTIDSTLVEIKREHIIPVFIKDNEPVISNSEFIEVTQKVVSEIFAGEAILKPNIRLSHPIKGRIPEAKNKPAKELLEHEKTIYYERMAFVVEVPTVHYEIDGNRLNLTIGGVKAYNLDNLYSKSGADQHFKVFIGFQNKVCTNLCVATDGYLANLKAKNLEQLQTEITTLIQEFNAVKYAEQLQTFQQYELTEHQFAQLIGRCRMYRYLLEPDKVNIPPLLFGESQINTVYNDYYRNESFCSTDGGINLWKLYNLFTGANKTTYIDNFLDRSVNAFELVRELQIALQDGNECWYLS